MLAKKKAISWVIWHLEHLKETGGRDQNFTQKKNQIHQVSYAKDVLQIFFTCQTHYLKEIRREQDSSRCDNSPKKKDIYVEHSLIWRHSVQNKVSTWKMNTGGCFCVL